MVFTFFLRNSFVFLLDVVRVHGGCVCEQVAELTCIPLKANNIRPPIRLQASSFPCSRRRFDLAAASKLRLLHRSVPPPPAGFAGVGRGGEPDLWVEILIKVVFSKD
jgi:hypothetical protein